MELQSIMFLHYQGVTQNTSFSLTPLPKTLATAKLVVLCNNTMQNLVICCLLCKINYSVSVYNMEVMTFCTSFNNQLSGFE